MDATGLGLCLAPCVEPLGSIMLLDLYFFVALVTDSMWKNTH